MKDSFNVGLDLVSDIAKNPAFAPQEIELQRKQMLSTLTVSYDDPEYLAGVVFERLVYGAHPYGRPDSGTPASLAAITRDDLVAFHQAWFGANNAILAIVGDVTADEAFAGAERAFGNWRKAAERRGARRGAAGPGPPARHHRPARRRADGDSRRATRRCRASIPTISRSISPSRSSAARAATGCTACCDPIAA